MMLMSLHTGQPFQHLISMNGQSAGPCMPIRQESGPYGMSMKHCPCATFRNNSQMNPGFSGWLLLTLYCFTILVDLEKISNGEITFMRSSLRNNQPKRLRVNYLA